MPVSRGFTTYQPWSPVKESPLQVPLTEIPQKDRRSTSRAPFIHLAKSLVNEPLSRFPSGAPIERDALVQSPFYITFIRLSKSPGHEPTPRFPNGATMEKMHITRAILNITFRVLSKEALHPRPSSPHRAPVEKYAPFPESFFNYLSRVPSEEIPLLIHLSLKVPGKLPLFHISPKGSL
jgi:hypothetical protein